MASIKTLIQKPAVKWGAGILAAGAGAWWVLSRRKPAASDSGQVQSPVLYMPGSGGFGGGGGGGGVGLDLSAGQQNDSAFYDFLAELAGQSKTTQPKERQTLPALLMPPAATSGNHVDFSPPADLVVTQLNVDYDAPLIKAAMQSPAGLTTTKPTDLVKSINEGLGVNSKEAENQRLKNVASTGDWEGLYTVASALGADSMQVSDATGIHLSEVIGWQQETGKQVLGDYAGFALPAADYNDPSIKAAMQSPSGLTKAEPAATVKSINEGLGVNSKEAENQRLKNVASTGDWEGLYTVASALGVGSSQVAEATGIPLSDVIAWQEQTGKQELSTPPELLLPPAASSGSHADYSPPADLIITRLNVDYDNPSTKAAMQSPVPAPTPKPKGLSSLAKPTSTQKKDAGITTAKPTATVKTINQNLGVNSKAAENQRLKNVASTGDWEGLYTVASALGVDSRRVADAAGIPLSEVIAWQQQTGRQVL